MPTSAMRLAAASLALAVLVGCGPSAEETMGRAVAAAAEPSVSAFVTDLEAGRLDAALARGTPEFRAAVPEESMRGVVTTLREVLGPLAGRTFTGAADLAEAPEGELSRAATLRYSGRYAKGTGDVGVRVVRGADGAWRIDRFAVEGPAFTWTLR